MKQDHRTVTNLFSQVEILWEELELYMPIPQCTCRIRCSCKDMRNSRNIQNLLHVIPFLIGLNDDHNVVKSQIYLLDPLPPLNNFFQWLFNMNIKFRLSYIFLLHRMMTPRHQLMLLIEENHHSRSMDKEFGHFCGKSIHMLS